MPSKEYVNQPSDAFFTLEIQPKKPSDRKKEMLRYRFVTKTIKKAGEICDFSENFLAQLAKVQLKVSQVESFLPASVLIKFKGSVLYIIHYFHLLVFTFLGIHHKIQCI